MYALVDCSNFFVSCERIFQPHLNTQPVVVLSSNDGCIISRSEEAKALGLPMGAPVFKVRSTLVKNNVHLFSSNFSLYSDMSQRVIHVLSDLGFPIEQYSVDEAFIKMPEAWDLSQLYEWATHIQARLLTWLGIPVRIGCGPTKTLAKLANEQAKKTERRINIWLSISDQNLENLLVSDVWGIGKRTAKTLNQHGVYKIIDLLKKPERWIKQTFNVTMLKTVREIKGIPCYILDEAPTQQKSMIVSRTFEAPAKTRQALKEYIYILTERAGEKLRQKGLYTRSFTLYIKTSRFKESYQVHHETVILPHLTNSTQTLFKAVSAVLQRIFQEGSLYTKGGLCLFELTDAAPQDDLFSDQTLEPTPLLMQAFDKINQRYGKGTLRFSVSENPKKRSISHIVQRNKLSPEYTTKWNDLLVVK